MLVGVGVLGVGFGSGMGTVVVACWDKGCNIVVVASDDMVECSMGRRVGRVASVADGKRWVGKVVDFGFGRTVAGWWVMLVGFGDEDLGLWMPERRGS